MFASWIMGVIVLAGALAVGYRYFLPVAGSLYRMARQKRYPVQVGQDRSHVTTRA